MAQYPCSAVQPHTELVKIKPRSADDKMATEIDASTATRETAQKNDCLTPPGWHTHRGPLPVFPSASLGGSTRGGMLLAPRTGTTGGAGVSRNGQRNSEPAGLLATQRAAPRLTLWPLWQTSAWEGGATRGNIRYAFLSSRTILLTVHGRRGRNPLTPLDRAFSVPVQVASTRNLEPTTAASRIGCPTS